MSAIRTESLVLGYRGKPLCEKLDFAVEPGEVVALFGENGVGKSTLLKTLVGALPPVSGSVFYGDANGAALKPGERAKRVSMVFARSEHPRGILVEDYVSLGCIPWQSWAAALSDREREAAEEAMELTATAQWRRRPLDELSDGERQRVFVARALAQRAPTILLDEPCAFLDPRQRVRVLDLLRRAAEEKGRAILFSDHDIRSSHAVCDRALALRRGGSWVEGKADDEAFAGELRAVFGPRAV